MNDFHLCFVAVDSTDGDECIVVGEGIYYFHYLIIIIFYCPR